MCEMVGVSSKANPAAKEINVMSVPKEEYVVHWYRRDGGNGGKMSEELSGLSLGGCLDVVRKPALVCN